MALFLAVLAATALTAALEHRHRTAWEDPQRWRPRQDAARDRDDDRLRAELDAAPRHDTPLVHPLDLHVSARTAVPRHSVPSAHAPRDGSPA